MHLLVLDLVLEETAIEHGGEQVLHQELEHHKADQVPDVLVRPIELILPTDSSIHLGVSARVSISIEEIKECSCHLFLAQTEPGRLHLNIP